jgi:2-succinyl-5-enolpyruvyl-6-hydroxy-3-cyclohexene-1-carboxylate synthase
VVNWHPALVEADAARLPLIVLSADRPPELHDCGANQTIDQRTLFGPTVRAVHTLPPAEAGCGWLGSLAARVVSQSRWPLAGPVQINVPLREPLLDAAPVFAAADPKPPLVGLPRLAPAPEILADLATRLSGRRGVILAGAEPLPAVPLVALAAVLDWPILADPLSGLRFGGHDRSRVLAHADLGLRGAAPAAEIVLRFGAFPVSKPVAQWLGRIRAEEIVVSPDPRWPDPARRAALMIHADPALLADGVAALAPVPASAGWMEAWRALESRALRLAQRFPSDEAALVATAVAALPEGGLLFAGNSMAIRDLDSGSGTGPKPLALLCNRGASGIDGTLATFFGALASGRFGAGLALLGDLTFLHDLGGLAAGQGLRGVILVLDNGGGAIFEHLPQAGLPEFETGWLTPQHADLEAAARVWGHTYRSVTPADLAAELPAALAGPGVTVIHIRIDRAASVDRHRALWAACASSMES